MIAGRIRKLRELATAYREVAVAAQEAERAIASLTLTSENAVASFAAGAEAVIAAVALRPVPDRPGR